ncbi:MAG: Purine nucleoside phosphorylase [uncultured Chthoniobacterales bacterium]|uniref:purine-nucleoside phosphorylase n=1 Tax=uncultured Chthoniobacterales bacterium TaxID=1836801 RepID=A0A6J4J104_9BACT|nr:MAG: Purine nucleoside phosphorylase [uncultured Chthoniobacterales bacterium]
MSKADPRARLQSWGADLAIVLGSGLGSLAEEVGSGERVPYSEFPELPPPRVPGHGGQFGLGWIGGTKAIFAQGRVHLYEGHSAHAATAGIRILAECGVKRVILTNAAGTTNPAYAPGSWMMISDHLNLTGTTPLLGAPAFIDMTATYSREWRTQLAEAGNALGIPLHEGVYAGLLGPQYETPAEVRMLRHLGADAIGMSTVLEAIQARALGLEVAGFSCLTNWAAGVSDQHLSHEEVLTTGKAAAGDLARLLGAAFRNA